LFCEFTNPHKEKYLVLVCLGARPLLLFINSRIHPYIARRPDLQVCQVRLSALEYDFLDRDSFVDCSKVIADFGEDDIKQQLLDDVGRVRGELNASTIREIITAVQSARTISPRYKRSIVTSLSGR